MLSHPNISGLQDKTLYFPTIFPIYAFFVVVFNFAHFKLWPDVKTGNFNRLISNLGQKMLIKTSRDVGMLHYRIIVAFVPHELHEMRELRELCELLSHCSSDPE